MTTLLLSLLFWESVTLLLTSEGNLYTLPRADPLMLWLAIQNHAISLKGWKSLCLPFQPQLQLVVMLPRLLERKTTGGFWESFCFLDKRHRWLVSCLPLLPDWSTHVMSTTSQSTLWVKNEEELSQKPWILGW